MNRSSSKKAERTQEERIAASRGERPIDDDNDRSDDNLDRGRLMKDGAHQQQRMNQPSQTRNNLYCATKQQMMKQGGGEERGTRRPRVVFAFTAARLCWLFVPLRNGGQTCIIHRAQNPYHNFVGWLTPTNMLTTGTTK